MTRDLQLFRRCSSCLLLFWIQTELQDTLTYLAARVALSLSSFNVLSFSLKLFLISTTSFSSLPMSSLFSCHFAFSVLSSLRYPYKSKPDSFEDFLYIVTRLTVASLIRSSRCKLRPLLSQRNARKFFFI